MYLISEKHDEYIMAQRPSYDKTNIGYFEGESSKKYEVIKEPDLVNQKHEQQKHDMNKVESNQSDDEPKQFGPPKVVKWEFTLKFYACNEIGHLKKDCTSNYTNPVSIYCYKCNAYIHKAIECRKPRYNI